jgi:hypothetical protein
MSTTYVSCDRTHTVTVSSVEPYVKVKNEFNNEIICRPNTDSYCSTKLTREEEHDLLEDIAREYKEKTKRLDAERARKMQEEEVRLAQQGKRLSPMSIWYGNY